MWWGGGTYIGNFITYGSSSKLVEKGSPIIKSRGNYSNKNGTNFTKIELISKWITKIVPLSCIEVLTCKRTLQPNQRPLHFHNKFDQHADALFFLSSSLQWPSPKPMKMWGVIFGLEAILPSNSSNLCDRFFRNKLSRNFLQGTGSCLNDWQNFSYTKLALSSLCNNRWLSWKK
jgi:hypothetical protein